MLGRIVIAFVLWVVVGIGVGGNNHAAVGQAEVHTTNQVYNFPDSFLESDVDQDKFATAIDKINIHSQTLLRLVVHLDNPGQQVLPSNHEAGAPVSNNHTLSC
jgi:hypothetical protein